MIGYITRLFVIGATLGSFSRKNDVVRARHKALEAKRQLEKKKSSK